MHGPSPHLFADVYGRCPPEGMSDPAARVSACSDDTLSWIQSNRLQLNADKTDSILCVTSRRLLRLQSTPTTVGSEIVSPSSTTHYLGVHIDSDQSVRSNVQRTVAGCFAAFRQIRGVRRSPPPNVLETLVGLLVLARLHYGNATLAGIPATLLRRLQAVLNASATTITGLPRSAYITMSLVGLHWLRAAEGHEIQVGDVTYRCLHCTAPRYLSAQLTRVADIPSRRRLRYLPPTRLVRHCQ